MMHQPDTESGNITAAELEGQDEPGEHRQQRSGRDGNFRQRCLRSDHRSETAPVFPFGGDPHDHRRDGAAQPEGEAQ